MDSVTGSSMAVAMDQCGGLGILSRRIGDPAEHAQHAREVSMLRVLGVKYPACAMGVRDIPQLKADLTDLCRRGLKIVCFDIANGNCTKMQAAIGVALEVRVDYPDLGIVAGNVCTGNAADILAGWGADAIKCGIGPGAACTTRKVTGFGVPQFSAIMDCASALKGRTTKLIADGGIRTTGDIAKCFWAGADTVMMGYLFAGHKECAMPTTYRGMSSRTVHGRSDIASEGIDMTVPARGSVVDTITKFVAALKASLSFGNAMNLTEFRRNVAAIRVSTMSDLESGTVAGE
jgi:IMP dehydrogenase